MRVYDLGSQCKVLGPWFVSRDHSLHHELLGLTKEGTLGICQKYPPRSSLLHVSIRFYFSVTHAQNLELYGYETKISLSKYYSSWRNTTLAPICQRQRGWDERARHLPQSEVDQWLRHDTVCPGAIHHDPSSTQDSLLSP